MSDQDVSLGEVYRLCQRIESKVDKTNGRVTELESDVAVLKDRGGAASNRDGTARNTSIGAAVTAICGLLWQWWKG